MNERRREGHKQGASCTAAGRQGEAVRHRSGKGPGHTAPPSDAREGVDAVATAGREKGRAAVTGEGLSWLVEGLSATCILLAESGNRKSRPATVNSNKNRKIQSTI